MDIQSHIWEVQGSTIKKRLGATLGVPFYRGVRLIEVSVERVDCNRVQSISMPIHDYTLILLFSDVLAQIFRNSFKG